MWDDTRRSQNIRQVNHQNQIVPNGFLSGSLMEAPGTFVECFNDLGIFYYRSDNAKGILGAVVVVPEPTVKFYFYIFSNINIFILYVCVFFRFKLYM